MILPSNVFEIFRSTCLKHYGLDPAHLYTSPGLAWQAYLKKTGIELELLTDPDMLLMFERGIRGGVTQAIHRSAKANNNYVGDKFNSEELNRFLQYLDANSLCGCVPTHVVTLTQVGTSVYLGQTHLRTPLQVPAWVRKFLLGSTGDEISSLIIIQSLFVQQKFEY